MTKSPNNLRKKKRKANRKSNPHIQRPKTKENRNKTIKHKQMVMNHLLSPKIFKPSLSQTKKSWIANKNRNSKTKVKQNHRKISTFLKQS